MSCAGCRMTPCVCDWCAGCNTEPCSCASDNDEPVGILEVMTTETPQEQFGYARVKRSISDGNYGSTEASISLPFLIEDGPDGPKTELNLKVAFIVAKTSICRELGIETKVLDDGTVAELLNPTPNVTAKPSASATQSSGQTAARPQSSGNGTAVKIFKRLEDPAGGENAHGKPNTIGNPDWLTSQIEAAAASGKPVSNELWDNRRYLPQFGGEGNPKAPWFKDKNGENAIWPPKGAPECDGTWRHPAFADGNYEEPF